MSLLQPKQAGFLEKDPGVPEPPQDSVSGLAFSPAAEFLSAASWDGQVRIYEVAASGEARPRAMYAHTAPALSTAWHPDGSKVLSGGCDNVVRAYDLQSGQSVELGRHEMPVKGIVPVDVGTPAVASVSWDKTLKYWDFRQQNPVFTVSLPERAYAIDSQKKLLVVACADRHICSIDLSNPSTIFKTGQSTLKCQTRSVACFIDGTGYAVGSVEGRCGIQYVDDARQSTLGFSFKCHREALPAPKQGETIYPINAISFHPQFGTFATAASSGSVSTWDKDSKFRIVFSKSQGMPVTAATFNKSGSLFAYSLGYDWSRGYNYNTSNLQTALRVHVVQELEVKNKVRTTTRR